jgi:small-conductance mechanosensitive channel
VALVDISNVGLEFEARVFLADVYESGTVQNDLRFAILDLFEREGIVISYAPRAAYPKEPVPPEAAPAADAAEDEPGEPEAGPAAKPRKPRR